MNLAAMRAGRSTPGELLVAAGLVVLGFTCGVALVAVASRFPGNLGPVAVVALPLLPVLLLVMLADPRVGLVVVVATFPLGVVDVPGLQLQLVQVAVLVAATMAALRRMATAAGPLPWVQGMGWLVAFVGWLLVALPSAPDQQRALRVVALFTVGGVFAAAVVAACRTTTDIHRFLAVLVAMVAAVAATTPFSTADVRARFGGAVVEGRATGIFVEPNQLGTFCTTGVLVAAGLWFAARSKRTRAAAAGAAALCLVGLLLSLSRGSWIGFVLGVVVLLAKLPEARRALVVVAVPLLLVAGAVGAFAPSSPQVEVVGQRVRSISGERNPYDDRPTIWQEATRQIVDDPLTGSGPGSFPVTSSRATSESRTTFADHAHNLLLTWGAEAGLPAVGIAIGLGVHLHLRTRRLARRPELAGDRAVLAGLAAALAGTVGQGIVDYTLHNSVVLTVLFALIGAVLAFETARPTSARPLLAGAA